MDDLTLGIIDAVKRGKKSGKESIIDFLSEYTGTPKEHYSDSKLIQIIRNAFIDYLKTAAEYGSGMRILKQSFWEALISFVISQNNNIPRIKKSIELLCEKFGKPIEKYGMVRYSFPTAKDLENISLDDLSDLGLGYRASYIYGICKRNSALIMPNYDMLLAIPGIGKKVASCIMLFGAYDLTQFPIDTWMRKLLDEVYDGKFDTTPYKGFEGFVQQLQFYYYRHLKGK